LIPNRFNGLLLRLSQSEKPFETVRGSKTYEVTRLKPGENETKAVGAVPINLGLIELIAEDDGSEIN